MTRLSTVLKQAPEHMLEPGDFQDTLQGILIRVVRNLPGAPFPGWSTAESRRSVAERILPRLPEMPEFAQGAFQAEMPELGFNDRQHLLLLNLISPCLSARQEGCHLLVSRKRDTLAMVNEEEHLVVHHFLRKAGKHGADGRLPDLPKAVDELCRHIDILTTYAWDAAGNRFLTSLPAECGSGVQLFALLHLPALNFANMTGQVTKAVEQLHLNISPYYADGHDDTGNRFMLYTVPGPDETPAEMVAHFSGVVRRLAERELGVRQRLLREPGQRIHDRIGRTYGMLLHARRLSVKEMRDAFSMLRLATVLGVIKWECGAESLIRTLNRLGLELAAAFTTAEDGEAAPRALADGCRAFLQSTPHTFNTPNH